MAKDVSQMIGFVCK